MSDNAKVFWHEPHVKISCVTSGSVVSESAVNEKKKIKIELNIKIEIYTINTLHPQYLGSKL